MESVGHSKYIRQAKYCDIFLLEDRSQKFGGSFQALEGLRRKGRKEGTKREKEREEGNSLVPALTAFFYPT